MRQFVLVLLIFVFAVVGIRAATVPKPPLASDEALTRLLVGTWHLRINAKDKITVSGSCTFGSNGRFTGEVRISGELLKDNFEGKWRIADGILIEEITKSPNPEIIPVGYVSKDQILLLEGNALETRAENGNIERFERK